MTGSVTFSTTIGGDGSTVTDDNNATTGLRDGGWKTRFVPCFTNQVSIANFIVTKANDCLSNATAAENSAIAAAASYDSFDDRYLGAKSSNPTVDNDGNTLIVGAIYWNTTSNVMLVWSGTTWVSYNPAISYLPLLGGTMTGNITFNSTQFGTNVGTFLATPSSANLKAALTDETGSGAAVFATSPTLVTPVLGTPASGDLSNCTNAVGYGIKSATTTVSVSGATAPSAGSVLTATSPTNAGWSFGLGSTFIASGTISNGDTVFLNSNGTVSSTANNPATINTAGSLPTLQTAGKITSCYDTVNNKIIIFYQNSSSMFSAVGTVSGATISFGTPVQVNTSAFTNGECCYVGSGKVFVCYDTGATAVKGRIGTISGTTISFGTENTILSGVNGDISCDYDVVSQNVIVAFRNTGTNGQMSLITISGTTFTFANSTFSSSAITKVSCSCDGLGNALILYTGASSGIYAVLATISGSAVSFSSVLTVSSITATEVESFYFSAANQFIIGYSSASFAGIIISSINFIGSWTLSLIYSPGGGSSISSISFVNYSNNSILISHNYSGSLILILLSLDKYKNFTITPIIGLSDSATALNLIYDSANLNNICVGNNGLYRMINLSKFNQNNVIGISSSSYTDTQNANIVLTGNKTSNNSGLSTSSPYYINEITGVLQTTRSSIFIGIALSSTSILVQV
jgi:hypothetical protein